MSVCRQSSEKSFGFALRIGGARNLFLHLRLGDWACLEGCSLRSFARFELRTFVQVRGMCARTPTIHPYTARSGEYRGSPMEPLQSTRRPTVPAVLVVSCTVYTVVRATVRDDPPKGSSHLSLTMDCRPHGRRAGWPRPCRSSGLPRPRLRALSRVCTTSGICLHLMPNPRQYGYATRQHIAVFVVLFVRMEAVVLLSMLRLRLPLRRPHPGALGHCAVHGVGKGKISVAGVPPPRRWHLIGARPLSLGSLRAPRALQPTRCG